MSESNNNIPMRITQLEEATAYEYGMYYAVAKAGVGTKKIDANKPTSTINYLSKTYENVLDLTKITEGGYYNASGVWTSSVSIYSSDYIPVNVGEWYVFKYTQNAVFWDENKDFVSYLSITQKIPFSIPNNPNIKYMTLFGIKADKLTDMIIKGFEYPEFYLPFAEKIINPMLESRGIKANKYIEQIKDELNYKINLLDLSECTDNGYYNASGVWTANTSLYSSGFIPVDIGETYYINPAYSQQACFWDEEENFITSYSSLKSFFEVPQISAIKYMTVFGTKINKNMDMVIRGDSYSSGYLEFNVPSIDAIIENKNKNTKVIMLGDSITWYDGHTYRGSSVVAVGYPSYLKKLGFNSIVNAGVSGACIAYHSDSQYTDIVTTAQNTDFSNYDIVTIAGGINDFKFWSSPLGAISSSNYDQTTIIGALQIIFEKILTDNINAKIAVFTPLKANGWESQNSINLDLMNYHDAIVEVCEYYSIPVLDLTLISGFNNKTISSYTIDGLHPNNDGYKIICESKMQDFVNSL